MVAWYSPLAALAVAKENSLFLARCMVCYHRGESLMTAKQMNRRLAAVKTANAINAIEGVPVSDYAKKLSLLWARGKLTGEQMKAALLASHKRMAERANNRVSGIK